MSTHSLPRLLELSPNFGERKHPTKPEQIAENVRASELPRLSPDTHRRLKEFYDAEIAPLIRGAY